MKLATLKQDGRRDGRLVVVSRDLARAVDAGAIAPTLMAFAEERHKQRPRGQGNSQRSSHVCHWLRQGS